MSTTPARQRPTSQERPPGGRPPSAGAVARRLAGAEARRQLAHPLVWLGFALSTAAFLEAVRREGHVPVLHRDTGLAANYVVPLLVGVLLTAYLAASRPARHGTEELLDTAPTSRATRTLGFVLGLPWALAVGVAWTLLATGILYLHGGVGVPFAGDLAQPALLVAFGAATGIVLGVWAPRPVVVVVALPVLILQLSGRGEGWVAHTLAPLLQVERFDLEWYIRPVGWHNVYLAGLVGLVAVAALVRDGVTARRVAAGATALAVLAAGAAGQLAARPSSAELDDLLAFAEEPPLVCTDHGPVQVCTLGRYAGLASYWAAPVEEVMAFAPEPARDRARGQRLRIEQQLNPVRVLFRVLGADGVTIEPGPGEHLAHLAGPFVPQLHRPTVDGLVIPSLWSPSRDGIVLALETARRIVGIPNGEHSTYTWTAEDLPALKESFGYHHGGHVLGNPDLPEPGTAVEVVEVCWLAGQAREVVAIWLAAASSPALAARLEEIVETSGLEWLATDTEHGRDPMTSQPYLASNAAVAWSMVGADLAVQLLAAAEARDRIFTEWEIWTAPETSTDDLAAAFGLVAPQREVEGSPDPYQYHGPISTAEGEAPTWLPRPLRYDASPCMRHREAGVVAPVGEEVNGRE